MTPCLRASLVLAISVAPAVLPQQTSSVRIALPSWAPTGKCWQKLPDRNAIVSRDQNSLTYNCPPSIELLSCDINGAEPIDVPLKTMCERPELTLRRATFTANVGTSDGFMTVDWLDVGAKGGVSFVASRLFRKGEPVIAPVAVAPRRLVRFSRADMSPVTVPSAELNGTWRLPPAAPGGELVLQRSDALVVPQRYRLVTNETRSMHEHGRGEFLVLGAVPAGEYQMTPIYAGGVPARDQKLRIEDGRSTFAFVASEDVGGVVVRMAPAICSEAVRIGIKHLSIESTTSPDGTRATRTLTTDVARIEPVSECETVVGGLRPGEYELVLDKREGQAPVRRQFQVQDNALTDVVIEPVGNRLSGKITLNGRPLAEATVEFMTAESPTRSVARGTTDAHGNYAAHFEKPGRYRATLRLHGVSLPGDARQVEVPAGETIFDWALTGGTLTVKLENLSPGTSRLVSLIASQIEPRVTDGRPGFYHSLRPDDPELMQGKVTLRGLGFGTYTIKAQQEPARRGDRTQTSPEVGFTLSEQNRDVSVTLVLADNFGQIVLTDVSGTPVRGARIYMSGASARETEPGMYSMDGIAPGAPLQIRAAGYTPLCRFAPETSVTVVLDAGRTVEVQFPGLDGKEASPWGWIQWRGSDCRVALDAFTFTKLTTGADGVPRFGISNFPAVGDVSHTFLNEPARGYQVLYGVLVIPSKK